MMIAPFSQIHLKKMWTSDDGKSLYLAEAVMDGKAVGQMVIMDRKNETRLMGVNVHVEFRRQQMATAMLNWICTDSPFKQKPIYLEVDSYQSVSNVNDPRPTDAELSVFYQRFGFIGVLGHPFAMVRFPVAKSQVYANN